MFNIDKRVLLACEKAMELCKEPFEEISYNTEHNQQKMLKTFIDSKVSESHFAGSTGYGYSDRGREVLDNV